MAEKKRRLRWRDLVEAPLREYGLITLLFASIAADYLSPAARPALIVIAALGSLPTLWDALAGMAKKHVGIDAFNAFAVIVSFVTGEYRSATFIGLMLAFARLLDHYTDSRTRDAVEELLKLKPLKAFRERGGGVEEVSVDELLEGDVLVVKSGSRVPADGAVVFGDAFVNESSVSGESALVRKVVGDEVMSGTLAESGVLKIRATRVGKDSTLERMATLMREASAHKSRSEKAADRFAGVFLPLVALLGAVTYVVTKDIHMTAALFLVACADDVAVAIPLAMTASLGLAARRGVIVKGGEWFEALANTKTLVLDKTGTLTYGRLSISDVHLEQGVDEERFWRIVGAAERYSEHPVGKAMFREAAARVADIPESTDFTVERGAGIAAKVGGQSVLIGNEALMAGHGAVVSDAVLAKLRAEREEHDQTTFMVVVDGSFVGLVTVADVPRAEAAESMKKLRRRGVQRIIMLTGDTERIAADVCRRLGIEEYQASMKPEDKLRKLEELSRDGVVAMIGDGINDAPALARADVGIAMGGGGTAVAVEAADVVILTDDLTRVSEMIALGRRTMGIIRSDIWIWVISNLIGFALVLTGVAGPAFAAFYNFATDFLPLINSSRLFRLDVAKRVRRAMR